MTDTHASDDGLSIYGGSLSLTDLYQLTMAYGYWRAGMAEREASFLIVPPQPIQWRVHNRAAGHGGVLSGRFSFDTSDLDYLATLRGSDGEPVFADAFLKYLGDAPLSCSIRAVEEGTIVFPHEPILRVVGPIWQAQILETAILNIVNFQTLIATKAARVVESTGGEPVLVPGCAAPTG